MKQKSMTTVFEQESLKNMDFRRSVLAGLMLFTILFLTWHTVAEVRYGFSLMAILEGAFTLYTSVLLYFVWHAPYTKHLSVAFVVPALAIILAAMFHPDTPTNVFVWSFLFPILSYTLLGQRFGFMVTIIGSTLAFMAYISKTGDLSEGHNILILTDVVICMGIIWVITHMYERYRERSVKALRYMATTDELTGMQNRRQIKQAFAHLSQVVSRQGKALAIVVVDLDHFKQINDLWGHDVGDAVLVHTAYVLRENLRKSDWAFRTGGEEFCLLLQVNDNKGALTAAETIRAAIEATPPCIYQDENIKITASIGVAVYPHEGESFERLQKCADGYMYCAKQGGRNRVVGSKMP